MKKTLLPLLRRSRVINKIEKRNQGHNHHNYFTSGGRDETSTKLTVDQCQSAQRGNGIFSIGRRR